jgi:hypothetical protein
MINFQRVALICLSLLFATGFASTTQAQMDPFKSFSITNSAIRLQVDQYSDGAEVKLGSGMQSATEVPEIESIDQNTILEDKQRIYNFLLAAPPAMHLVQSYVTAFGPREVAYIAISLANRKITNYALGGPSETNSCRIDALVAFEKDPGSDSNTPISVPLYSNQLCERYQQAVKWPDYR